MAVVLSPDDIDFLIMRHFAANRWRKPAQRVEQLEYLLSIPALKDPKAQTLNAE